MAAVGKVEPSNIHPSTTKLPNHLHTSSLRPNRTNNTSLPQTSRLIIDVQAGKPSDTARGMVGTLKFAGGGAVAG
jgi:hypothetical protein